ncbi:DUF115 domain-containing protein [bacterium]|nr:DUF115 domain-containing protein [bacterium]
MAKKNDFWGFKLKLDDYFFVFSNTLIKVLFFLKGNKLALKNNINLKGKHKHKEAYIVLNGPSLKNQDIKPLKDKVLFFVNRAFKHEDYKYLKPDYHVFVDPKLASGEWPLTFLDTVLEINPNVTLILNHKWFNLPKFQPYREMKNVYWVNCDLFFTQSFNQDIDLCKPMPGLAVFGTCFNAAVYTGCKKINFVGFDSNGLPHEMVNSSESHFYGKNEENELKTTKDFIRDLVMMSRSLTMLHFVADFCKRKNIQIFNSTEGGLLDMFEREEYPFQKIKNY